VCQTFYPLPPVLRIRPRLVRAGSRV
jgi:hypothetical protein